MNASTVSIALGILLDLISCRIGFLNHDLISSRGQFIKASFICVSSAMVTLEAALLAPEMLVICSILSSFLFGLLIGSYYKRAY
jgi:hypothetical protein